MLKSNNKKTISKIVLAIGIILTILLPILFTYVLPLSALKEAGSIGDTIGGITSPVVAILGSLLLYFALSDQIEANNLLSQQIEDAKDLDVIHRDLEHISELYRLFEKNIDSFPFEVNHFNSSAQVKLYLGSIAITHFVDDLIMFTGDSHDTKKHLMNHGIREFMSIVKSADLFVDKVQLSRVSNEDKIFYKNLILHKINYNLSPDFSRISDMSKSYVECDCGKSHGNFPIVLFEEIERVKEKINKL